MGFGWVGRTIGSYEEKSKAGVQGVREGIKGKVEDGSVALQDQLLCLYLLCMAPKASNLISRHSMVETFAAVYSLPLCQQPAPVDGTRDVILIHWGLLDIGGS